ncbi:MAG: hypothetical protein Q9179_003502 [Wetmoreana sp. 5 TL-2023]
MPLAAVYQLFVVVKKYGRSSSDIFADVKKDAIHVVSKEDFTELRLDAIKSQGITDDLQGFLSVVISYAKATRRMKPEDGPKHSLSIMPRADFVAMYKFVKDKIEPQYQDGCYDLYTIIKELARIKGDLSNERDNMYDGDQLDQQSFKWKPLQKESTFGSDFDGDEGVDPVTPPPPPATPLPPPPPSYVPGYGAERKWNIYLGTSREAPISEFKDLMAVFRDDLQAQLGELEDALVKLHKKYATSGPQRSIQFQQRAPAPPASQSSNSKKRKSCPRKECPSEQVRTAKSSQCEAYPKDKVPIKLGDQCKDKCLEGQGRTSLGRKCGACPKGQKPTLNGDGCKRECPAGQAKTGLDAKCEACPHGKQPNVVSDKCEDKCSSGQVRTAQNGKCETYPEGKKPNAAGDQCQDDKARNQVQPAVNAMTISAPMDKAKTGLGGKCEACPKGKKPTVTGDRCGDDKRPDGQAKVGPDGKCEACPKGEKANLAGDKCNDDDQKQEKGKKGEKESNDKKTKEKGKGSKGGRFGGISG